MVIHDESRAQLWIQAREEEQQKAKIRPPWRLSVIAVQSIACCAAVLLTMLLRVAGGEAYQSIREKFYRALSRNEWVSALTYFWDDQPLEKIEETVVDNDKEENFTERESAQLTGSSAAVAAVAPLESGKLTSGYGERIHPINGEQEFHTGVDIAAPLGTSLVAMYDGEVVEAGEDALLGKYIRLRHRNGIDVLYGHCEEIIAKTGEKVTAGMQVALVGSTGVSTGSHVHIRVNVDGAACDPEVLFSLARYA